MTTHAPGLTLVSLIVTSYDVALDFFINTLGFELVEDTPSVASHTGEAKRWVVVRPPSYPSSSSSDTNEASNDNDDADDTQTATSTQGITAAPALVPGGAQILLAQASTPEQKAIVGKQWAGRVGLFWRVGGGDGEFERVYQRLVAKGVEIVREPKRESYGVVCVFRDCEGNLWDLLGD